MAKWKRIKCRGCRGHGVVSGYTAFGTDFIGPVTCDPCGGSGILYVTESDRLALYPGGPFRGTAPGYYEEADAEPFDPVKEPLPTASGEAAASETREVSRG